MEIKADCRSPFRSEVERAGCQFPAEFNRLGTVVNGTSGRLEASAVFSCGPESKQKANSFNKKGRVCIARLIPSPSSTCSDNSFSFPRWSRGRRGLECYLDRSVSTGNISARAKMNWAADLECFYVIFSSTQFLTHISYFKLI